MCAFFVSVIILSADLRNSNDLEWDGESKRIIAVGDGREKCVQTRPWPIDDEADFLI